MHSTPPPVSIVGAGLGGLTLARVLRRHGLTAVIYEGEPSASARTQGGQLDMHEHNGQVALAAAGLMDEFRSIIHAGAEASRILDEQGSVLFEEADDGAGHGRPEVLRGDLRRVLLESLPADTVAWGRRLAAVRSLGAGGHELTFTDGSTTVTHGILVGADGAWSKVRALVSPAVPAYGGTTYVETYLRDVDEKHPGAARAVGAGSMFVARPGRAIAAHREAGGVIHTYVQLRRSDKWFAAIDFSDPAAARARVAAEFEGWAPELIALITDGEDAPVVRPIHEAPDGYPWQRVPGVTLVGDAAHLMPPAGEGANLAMLDGAELAQAVAAHPDDHEAALAAYEATMFPRSQAEAVDAAELQDLCLGDRAPFGLIEFFERANLAG